MGSDKKSNAIQTVELFILQQNIYLTASPFIQSDYWYTLQVNAQSEKDTFTAVG